MTLAKSYQFSVATESQSQPQLQPTSFQRTLLSQQLSLEKKLQTENTRIGHLSCLKVPQFLVKILSFLKRLSFFGYFVFNMEEEQKTSKNRLCFHNCLILTIKIKSLMLTQ